MQFLAGSNGNSEVEPKSSLNAREAFFLDFAKAIRDEFPQVPLMVTGGFRSRQGMRTVLQDGGCDLIGIGRPSVMDPLLPKNIILNSEVSDEAARVHIKKIEASWAVKFTGVKVIGAGAESVSISLLTNGTHD